jgi:hypothetical protein
MKRPALVPLTWIMSTVLVSTVLVAESPAVAEVFVDMGIHSTRVEADIATLPEIVETTESGWHLGVGVRRALAKGNIGVRLELDDVDSDLLLALRALDYRRSLTQRIAIGGFLGAARLDLDTPAYGYYFGGTFQVKDLLPRWDLALDLRVGDKLARDNLLSTDPQGGRPDNFYDLTGLSLYLSRRF